MSTEPRTQRLPRPFVGVCVAVALIAAAWSGLSVVALASRHSERSTRHYAASDLLKLSASNGDVTILAEERDDVRVDARASWSLVKPDVELRRDGDRLVLDGSCGPLGDAGFNGCSTSFEIRVPRATRVEAVTASGDVRAAGTAAPTRLEARSGDVRAEDVSGPLDLHTSSGDVAVLGFSGPDVRAGSRSGDVTVRAETVPDRIEARTSSGDVTVAVPDAVYAVETDTSSGEQRVQVRQNPAARRRIHARTSSGDVHVVRLDDAR